MECCHSTCAVWHHALLWHLLNNGGREEQTEHSSCCMIPPISKPQLIYCIEALALKAKRGNWFLMKKIIYKVETVLRKTFNNCCWKIREAALNVMTCNIHFKIHYKKKYKRARFTVRLESNFFRNAASSSHPSTGKLQREITYKKSLTILCENTVLSKASSPIILPN